MKGETQPIITAEQRKAFADQLKPNGVARERALTAYRDAESELRSMFVGEEAGKCGALELAREIVDLHKRQADQEHTLKALGFDADSDDGDISLRYDAPRALKHSIDERVRKQLGSERDIQRKYDQGMTKVLTASTAEEAATIVESLL
jgi:hypothetical protein